MTSELNFDDERSVAAHRTVFAILAAVMSRPPVGVRDTVRMFVDVPEDPAVGQLLDVIEVLTMQTLDGMMRTAGGDVEVALEGLRDAALDVEHFLRDTLGETGP